MAVMTIMTIKYYPNKLLFFNIIFIIISQSISYLYFTYPNSISLSNGNILIIHESGITICNYNLSEIINNITNFNENEILTIESLSRVTLASDNNYIFNIINDKIYIFDSVGSLLYESETKILSDENPCYYTLILMKIENDNGYDFYYYMIGFVYNSKLNFQYYKFNLQTHQNIKIYQKELKYMRLNSDNVYSFLDISNNGLSCQYMIHETKGESLVCAFLVFYDGDYEIVITHYDVGNSDITESNAFSNIKLLYEEFSIVKSAINYNHTKSLFCFYLNTGVTSCVIYNIKYELENVKQFYIYNYNVSLFEELYYGFKVDYFVQNNGDEYYFFSCIYDHKNIYFSFFDGNNTGYNEDYINYQTIKGFSLLYLKNYDNYFIISDAICNGEECPFIQIYDSEDEQSDENNESEHESSSGETEASEGAESSDNEENIESSEITEKNIVDISDNSESSNNPTSSDNSEGSEDSETSVNLEGAENSEKTDNSEGIDNSEESEHSEGSEESNASQDSENSDSSEESNTSQDSENSDSSEESDISQGSENSDGSEATENSEISDILESQEAQEDSETSENFESSSILENEESTDLGIIVDNTEDIKNKEEDYSEEITNCNFEKCGNYSKESITKCLCLTCNIRQGFYLLNNLLSKEKNLEIYGNYIDCVNDTTKPSNFYYNQEKKDYEECYETCNTCFYSGDKNENNCSSCEINYIKEPDKKNSSNCVMKCPYLYYYNSYGKYKCTPTPNCPDDFNLLIKEKKKCVKKCQNDDIYRFNYDGKCLKECPSDTKNNDFKCEDNIINKCILTEKEDISINENITENEIEKISKK